ncbi:hypothetical protein [Dyella sp. ASV21]|uniref:hypothetical protein n=1 Tax=Dyella sp. ASV21 TaxID=2795114 RepID=UPI0018EB6CD2|nr:hypothetical protein [Dyella sp. ASV21]
MAVLERRLATLQSKGLPITTAVFPHAEHDMNEYELQPDGTRVDARYSQGYMRLTIDDAKGALHGPYGVSQMVFPKRVNVTWTR